MHQKQKFFKNSKRSADSATNFLIELKATANSANFEKDVVTNKSATSAIKFTKHNASSALLKVLAEKGN